MPQDGSDSAHPVYSDLQSALIYESRAEREIYLLPNPDVSFGEFANFYNTVASSTSDLHIGLITRQLQAQMQKSPPGSYQNLDWHGQTYIPCAWILVRPVYIPRPVRR